MLFRWLGRVLFDPHPDPDFFEGYASRAPIAPAESARSLVARTVTNLERERLVELFVWRGMLIVAVASVMLYALDATTVGSANWLRGKWSDWREKSEASAIEAAGKAAEEKVAAARAARDARLAELQALQREVRR